MKNVLVLDFDGLICDGLKECVLVTWNGHYKKDASLFSDQGLEAIPSVFIERFLECRNFSKHLGHFLVPLVDQTTPFPDQDAFNSVYSSIEPAIVNEFMEKVSAYPKLRINEKIITDLFESNKLEFVSSEVINRMIYIIGQKVG